MVLRRINLVLTFVVAGLALYLVGAPLWPYVTLAIARATDGSEGYRYQSNLADLSGISGQLAPRPEDRRLVIPKISVDAPILEGASAATLDQGIWRRPQTSTPPEGSNTVLTGHRFLYRAGPITFYHLDKLNVGDQFAVFWDGIEYDYVVSETKVVSPDAIEVEAPTSTSTVTLYTCTPLLSSRDRLVVVATLTGQYE